MPDLCEDCGHFYLNYTKSKKPTPEYKCILGHKIVKSSDGWVPDTPNYICKDFIEKYYN